MDHLSERLARLSPEKLAILMERLREKEGARTPAPSIPRRQESGPAPLSFAQQRLWFVDRMDPGTIAYNTLSVVRLEGALEVEALQRALDAVLERHEALRTVFAERGGEPVQVVVEGARAPIEVADLRGLPPEEAEAEVGRRIRLEPKRPFDLERGPLLRATLLRTADDRHHLLLGMHHIVGDGWSRGVLVREVSALYAACVEEREPELPELPVQYADYAVWQRERLGGDALRKQLDYWTERLRGAPAVLELPVDRPRPPVQSFEGGTHRFRVPAEVAEGLRRLAREEEATLYMVLLAAFKVLLHRCCGEDDLVVGTPVSNRGRAETESLVGYFANTLALRTDLSGDPAFREALRRVRETALGAYAHEELPFERLVEELHPPRDLSRPVVFQVAFLLDSAPVGAVRLPGVELLPVEADAGISPFDLTLKMEEGEEGVAGAMEYAAALFEAESVARMAESYLTLLRGVVEAPDRRVSELPLLSGAGRRALEGWSAGEAPAGGAECVHRLFEVQARRLPAHPAVVRGGEALAYAELEERANRLGHFLRGRGVGPEARVGVCLETGPELLVALLGVLKAGGAYVPLDPDYPEERLAYMLDDSGVEVLLTRERLLEALPEHGGEVVCLDRDWPAVARESGLPPAVELSPESLAYVIYTSGSTGRPKGVGVQHGALANLVSWHARAFGVGPADRAAQVASLGFDAAVWEIWPYLAHGATLHVPEAETRVSPEALRDFLLERGVTLAFAPTPLAEGLLALEWPAEAPLRALLTGGDALRAHPRPGLPFALVNDYGPTECAVVATSGEVPPAEAAGRAPGIGRPIAGARTHVLDARLGPVPAGVPGELYVGGAGVARGYLGDPRRTAERFVPDPFGGAGARLYRTGDRVRWRGDGTLEFLGRADRQVKVRGFRIEPGEVEAALQAHPAVKDAVVEAQPGAGGEKRLVAYLIAAEGGDAPSVDELRAHLRERLPEYMVPASFVSLRAFPLTPSGKLDRRALPEPGLSGGAGEHVAPRTPTEELLAGIWAEVLGVERVGAHDDFFDLGGHSLLAARVASRVREAAGVELPVRVLFEAPTVAGLAGRVERLRGEGAGPQAPPLVPVPRDRPLPLSSTQQRLWLLHQLEDAPASYNLAFGLRLRGALSVEALRGSLEAVVARHEALRTRFVEERGEPVQVVEPARTFVLPVVDLGPFPETEREARVADYAAREAEEPFDLEEGPLLRATLLRLAGEEHVLLVGVHHVVFDGWSAGVFTRELRAHYEALLRGGEAGLPPLSVQYGDYAAWERSRAEGERGKAELDFWKRELAGAPAALELPADRPRPAVQRFGGASLRFRLDARLAGELRALARREDCTLFMVLLAGFKAFLHRYTGESDLVVGTPTAGRSHPALEPLIGCFINVLPLRTRIDGGAGFRELLRRVRSATLDAYPHQGASFDRIVEAAGIPRETSRNPLVQVLFALQNTPTEPFTLPGVEGEPLETEGATSRYDLSVYLGEEPDGALSGLVEFNTDLYERSTVERWMRHFARLVEALAADPDGAPGEAAMLDGGERERILREWNRTDAPLDGSATVPCLLEAQARRTPDAEALVAGGRTLTYAELNARANRLAHLLRERGVGPERRVGLLLERSAEMVVAMLAVLKAGGAYLPLDPAYPGERLRLMVEDAGAALVLAEDALRGSAPGGVPVLTLGEALAAGDALPDTDPEVEIHPESAAYVIYTSGSTGRPKGVVVQHRNVASFFAGMRERVGDAPARWLAVTSISFDISVLEILWTLSRGSTVVLHGARPAEGGAPEAGKAARRMDFSLFYFASGAGEARGRAQYRLLLEGAKFADRNGFSAVWTPERHFHAFGGLYPNPSVTSAAVATITERIRLRAGSVVLPLHDPIRVAEEWSVVDNLSDGRVEISFASGWHANDFVLAPGRYDDRKGVMFAHIEEVRRLWRGEKVTRVGGKGDPVEVGTLPRPVQPELPFWVTAGGSPETFRRAGEVGANLLTHLLGQSVEELAEKVRAYREGRRAAGLDPETGRVALMLHTFVDDDPERVREAVREPFREYLRSSFDLVLQLAGSAGYDPKNLSPEDTEAMLDFAADRYLRTSGLMGTPESCVETVRGLRAVGVDEIACLIDFGVDEDRALGALEGLRRVMVESNEEPAPRPETASVAEQIRAHGITHLQCTPSMAGMLAADPDTLPLLGGLSAVLLGGEALPTPLAGRLREAGPARILNLYGPTETTVWSATHEVAEVSGPVPIGRPIANTRIYVVDAGLQPVPPGAPGELLIGGEGVARGYHGRPDATAERFVPDPFATRPGGRLYRTGDLARWRADGVLEFLGRADQQVKVRGHRIEPGEIETALAGHPAVRESVVVARDDGSGERRLVAYVVPATREAPPALPPAVPAGERERILEGLPRYTLPGGAVVAHQQDFLTAAVYREVFEDGVYLRHGITLEDGACVVDVGSNMGMFTLFAHARARGVRSYSFEPIPDTFAVLSANARLFGLDARVFNAGLAERSGTARFTYYPNSSGLSGRYADVERDREVTRSVIETWLAESGRDAAGEEVEALLDERFRSETFDCPIRTLSDVIREEGITRIDYLKVDAEKSEYDVLLGIEEEHWPLVRQVVMEVDTEELLEKVTALLGRHGYEHLVDRHVTVRAGAGEGDAGEHVYMLYARRPGDGAPLRRSTPAEGGADAAPPSASELRRWLGERLPDYMVPSLFVALDALPLTPNGKVDRRALPEAKESRPALEVDYAPPGSVLEETISGVWQEVLGVERVGVRDNFFELGGTSIRLATVHRILSERLEREIAIVDLFRHPTVAGLAEFLGREGEDDGARERARDRAARQRAARGGRQRRERRQP